MTNPNQHDQPKASRASVTTQNHAELATPRNSKRFDAFLSHNSQDKQDVEKIREKLEAAGIKIWVDRNELSGGDSLPTTLKRALQNSAACVVFIGAHGVGRWQEKEIAAADKLKRPKRRVIPVLLPGSVRDSPASLKEKELLWIEFRDFDDQLNLNKLIKDIRTKVKDQSRWDRIRGILITAGILIPLIAISWATKEFCTFQAEFTPLDYDQQRQEIVITRRFDPRPQAWQFCQGTWIFKDERRDRFAENQISARFELNVGQSPNWSPLIPRLTDSRIGLAEIEWLDCTISEPVSFVEKHDVVDWGRAASEPVIAAAIAALMNSKSEVCFQSAKSLVTLGRRDKAVIDAIIVLHNHPNEYVRANVAELLGRVESNATTIKTLAVLLKDPDRYVVSKAAASLVQLRRCDDVMIKEMLLLLRDPDDNVRWSATECVGCFVTSDAAIIDVLVALLKDPDYSVRRSAVQSLGQLKTSDDTVVTALLQQLDTQDSDLRGRLATSLGQVWNNEVTVIDALITLLTDKSNYVYSRAEASLVNLMMGNIAVIDRLAVRGIKLFGNHWDGLRRREFCREAGPRLGC